jgi:ribosomal protein L11 methyltransferase
VLRYEVGEIGDGWKYEYQRFFETKRVTDRIVVSPPWEDYAGREGEIVIEILPGAAFGTGTHETTRLSLIAMERIFSTAKIDSLLDVGTGSGILAIAGALLGAGRVLAVDIDKEAVNSAADNAVRNGVRDVVEIRHEGFGDRAGTEPDPPERFDLVVANITGGTIKRLADSLQSLANPGGYLILSGFLKGEADEILGLFGDKKRFSATKDSLGEWSAVTVKGPAR